MNDAFFRLSASVCWFYIETNQKLRLPMMPWWSDAKMNLTHKQEKEKSINNIKSNEEKKQHVALAILLDTHTTIPHHSMNGWHDTTRIYRCLYRLFILNDFNFSHALSHTPYCPARSFIVWFRPISTCWLFIQSWAIRCQLF